jgi:hypothetical protein
MDPNLQNGSDTHCSLTSLSHPATHGLFGVCRRSNSGARRALSTIRDCVKARLTIDYLPRSKFGSGPRQSRLTGVTCAVARVAGTAQDARPEQLEATSICQWRCMRSPGGVALLDRRLQAGPEPQGPPGPNSSKPQASVRGGARVRAGASLCWTDGCKLDRNPKARPARTARSRTHLSVAVRAFARAPSLYWNRRRQAGGLRGACIRLSRARVPA